MPIFCVRQIEGFNLKKVYIEECDQLGGNTQYCSVLQLGELLTTQYSVLRKKNEKLGKVTKTMKSHEKVMKRHEKP